MRPLLVVMLLLVLSLCRSVSWGGGKCRFYKLLALTGEGPCRLSFGPSCKL